jgi:thiol-disulfide isomerase/thioredoxin
MENRKVVIFIIIIIIIISIIAVSLFAWYQLENLNDGLEFSTETVDNAPHPIFVKEAVDDAPVFIYFTQNDENCPPCARMRPEFKELIDEYKNKVIFYIININEDEIEHVYKNEEETEPISNSEQDNIYGTYDIENIVGGGAATPTFVIVIKDGGKIKFAIGYGEFENEDAGETREKLEKTLDYALTKY